MSRKYKFLDKEGLHFVSFATVYWIDLFVRDEYFQAVVESMDYCRKNKGMEIYCWCIMPSHVHLIFRAVDGNPEVLLGRLKEFTSKQLQKMITENVQESRREWLLWMFEQAGKKSSNVKGRQLWQHHNKPIGLWSPEVIDQKVEYIHQNPVVAGFVNEPEHWRYSSAMDYAGSKGLLEIDFIG
ncbi:transposase [Cytophagales bacterium LB-30]|uniref:Transposase n=1 Tax=Shiella aurantiaca TaxID=3058365 RepID=A0ABT8F9E4_9BACT|nr:transposase [Shiella aurantiaca]MDN4167092.1 transposase [Shiella aurantiaca]